MTKVVDAKKQGRWYKVVVPDDAPEELYAYGIIVGPPDLSSLGLPPSIEMRLHNELFVRGLISKRDVRSRMPDIISALQAALKVDAQLIAGLYEGAS